MVKPRLVKPMMMGGGGGDRPNNNPTLSSVAKDKNGRQQSSSMQPSNPQQNQQQQQQQHQRLSRQQGNRSMMDGGGMGKANTHHLPHLHFGSPDISRLKSKLAAGQHKLANMIPISPNMTSHHYHNTSDASDLDYAESQHHHSRHHYDRHHRPPFRRRESHGPSRQEYRRPFQIPSHVTLSSRADLWITVALSSLITLVSFVQVASSDSKEILSTSNRQFAFTTSILSFLIATVLGVAFRHAPARHQLTRCITLNSFDDGGESSSPILSGIQQSLSQRYITIELLLVSLLSFFWIISISIIVDGFYTIRQDPLAVSGTEIWNSNLFYSSWISVILVGYIQVELITSTDRYGALPASSSSSSIWKANTFSKRWILLTLSSIVVMSSSANIYGSNLCYGSILKGTTYCRTALMGIMIGGFVQLLFCCCVGVLYRLRNMNYTTTDSGGASYYYDSRGRRRTVEARRNSSTRRKMSIWKRDKYSLYFAIVSLIIQSINVALITNPVGGGPGNSSGSLYFASWLGFFLVFEMFLRYLELHTTSVGRRGKRKNEYLDDSTHSVETGYSSEEDDLPPERQSNVERILRTGSLGSRTSSGADVYEANDSYSAEYQSSRFQAQAPQPPSQQQPQYLSLVPMKTEDGPPKRPQKEPEEEIKTSPNSSSRDFAASVRDFSIGSRQSSRDPSVDGRSALYSEASDSEDISNEQLFVEQGRSSYTTYDSKESEDPRTPDNSDPYFNLEASRHSNKSLSPLNESSREGRRSSSSLNKSEGSSMFSGSEQKASQSGSEFSDSRQSGSYQSGSQYTSEDSREENVPNRSRPNSAQKGNLYSRPNSRNSGNARSRSSSRGKSNSPRSRGSYENSYIQTDSDSSSSDASPPPTESDAGQSQKSNLSGFSEGSPATQSQSKSTRSDNNGRNNGPPPPPFQPSRQPQSSLSGSQFTEDYQNPRPVKSVFARKGMTAEDQSVVSDPTLDPCFHNIPVPTQKKHSTRMRKNFSDPSFEKSVASSEGSNYRRSSSDELPSSEEKFSGADNGSGSEQVDNIVAAALAFAEKTHSVSSYGLQRAQASGTSSKKKHGSGTSGGKKNTRTRRRRSDSGLRESQTSGGSSAILSGASLHSFYSGDMSNPSNAGLPPKKKKSESEGFNDSLESNPTNTPSVEDMVSAAIAYAEKNTGVRKSANSSGKESNGKSPSRSSVGSMFSDSEAYSEASGSDFDC